MYNVLQNEMAKYADGPLAYCAGSCKLLAMIGSFKCCPVAWPTGTVAVQFPEYLEPVS